MGCSASKSTNERQAAKPAQGQAKKPAAQAQGKAPAQPSSQKVKADAPADKATRAAGSAKTTTATPTQPPPQQPQPAPAAPASSHEPMTPESNYGGDASAVPPSAVATAPAEEVSSPSFAQSWHDGKLQEQPQPENRQQPQGQQVQGQQPHSAASNGQRSRSPVPPLHQASQTQHVADANLAYAGPGPSKAFTTDHIYRCFDERNGLLFRLVNDRQRTWAFYNDAAEYMMHVSVTFGPESAITALGNTRKTVLNEETGECRLELGVRPGEMQPFMRGEYNGFTTCYDATPVQDEAAAAQTAPVAVAAVQADGSTVPVRDEAEQPVDAAAGSSPAQKTAVAVTALSEAALTAAPGPVPVTAASAAPPPTATSPSTASAGRALSHDETNAHMVEKASVTDRNSVDGLKKVREEA